MEESRKYYYDCYDPQRDINFRHYIHDINYYRFNWHRDVEISLILRGKAEFCVQGAVYLLEENDLLLINSNVGHASLMREAGSIAMVLRFDPTIFRRCFPDYTNLKFRCISPEQPEHVETFRKLRCFMARMMRSYCAGTVYSKLEIEGCFSLLCSLLLQNFYEEKSRAESSNVEMSHQRTMKKVLSYIDENYQKKISLQQIADIAKYSRTYVSTFFKENIGLPFYEYLTRIRLRHAIYEINTTKKSLTTIALDSGFPDLKMFHLCFKKNFNKTPNQYRTMIQDEQISLSSEEERHFFPLHYGKIEDKLEKYADAFEPRNLSVPQAEQPSAQPDALRKERLHGIIAELRELLEN